MQLAGGALIFGAFIVFAFFVVAYSYYTRRGSGINQHPYGNRYEGQPGAWRPSSLSHDERASIWVRGTR